MSDYPMLISNKLHSFRNFYMQSYGFSSNYFFSRATFYTPCASYYQKQETITLNNE